MVGADREGVVEAERAGGLAHLASAVDLVACQPAGLDTKVAHALERDGCQLWLGGERNLAGDVHEQAAFLVFGPVGAQVQGPVDQRVSARRGVGEVDGDLAQADPPSALGENAGGRPQPRR